MLNPYSLTIIWSRPTGISVDHEWWEIVQFHTPATLNVTDDDDCWSFAKMLIGGGGKKIERDENRRRPFYAPTVASV